MVDAVNQGDSSPVFVVGAPRSGTTLLASMIGSHRDFFAGPETHFFPKVRMRRIEPYLPKRLWVPAASRRVRDLRLMREPIYGLYGLSRDEVERFLSAQSIRTRELGRLAARRRAMLDSIVRLAADRAGRPRFVEKTPDHLLHIDAIRRSYPDARFIRMIRDPRGSSSSMRVLPWASQHAVVNALLWERWHRESAPSIVTADDVCMTVKFEELLTGPRRVLEDICLFVGAKFDESMLEFQAAGASVSSAAETWKRSNATALDPSRAFDWRERLSEQEKRAISVICSHRMESLGYEPTARASGEMWLSAEKLQDYDPMCDEIMRASERDIAARDGGTASPRRSSGTPMRTWLRSRG